jgi:CDP-diacylglycerol--serine O-phosphatidyltransferase
MLIGVSFLMVSKIPTYSGKRFRVPHQYVLPMLLVVGVLTAFLVTAPWTTITIVGLLYLIGIPLSVRAFNRLKKDAAEMRAEHEKHDEMVNVQPKSIGESASNQTQL